MTDLFVIVGLGNPGQKHAETRHNAGFWFLDMLARQASATFKANSKLHCELVKTRLHGQECVLVKPTTYMNHSGQAVRAVMDYFKADVKHLLVAYDELDLSPGIARLKQGGGHGGHNGMRDIFRHLSDQEFLRLRIGIGHPGYKDAVSGYVLSRATAKQEKEIVTAMTEAQDVMSDVLNGDLALAMNHLHRD